MFSIKIEKQVLFFIAFIFVFSKTGIPLQDTPPVWKKQTVYSDWVSSTSIGLDSSDDPHIAFSADGGLNYARWTGTTWDIQTIDSNMEPTYISLAVDSLDYPHVCYSGLIDYVPGTPPNYDLKYAHWTGSSWNIQTVDSENNVGQYCSIDIDSKNYPHISYFCGTYLDLKYARWSGTKWDIQIVDSDYAGKSTSIALDRNDYPHIIYQSYGSPRNLKYARWTGTHWTIQWVDTDDNAGSYSSLCIDSNGTPHLSYFISHIGDLRYATWTGNNWDIHTVDSEGFAGLYSSLALDSKNRPHISYYEQNIYNELRYAHWTGSSWEKYMVDGDYGAGKYTSIAVDSGDEPHISYSIAGIDGLRYTCFDKGDTSEIPTLSFNRRRFNFAAIVGGYVSEPQELIISNSGGGILDWDTGKFLGSWLVYDPKLGTGPATITLSVDPSGLEAGEYYSTINFLEYCNAWNTPQKIRVNLTLKDSTETTIPFGDFSTPVDGTTGITGAIPVTGWILDDIGVESVKVYRSPVAGESTEDLVYIGDAMLVEGARPDVEQAYPDYPLNYQAGWGYMMLTNFLPGQGNGTYKIHAHATDLDGHTVSLGTKTIHCDNVNAIKPFGAIDTPTQGGTVTGPFFNAGWALTPIPNSIPTDGSTINVWVDGQALGHPAYNQYREDIATLFPGYENTGGAVGAFYLDTTTYTNGVHTIAWSVSDNAGNSDGIGSRFFTIANAGGSAQAEIQNYKEDFRPSLSYESVLNMPVNFNPVKHKRGYKEDVKPRKAKPNEYGQATVEIREVERVKLELGGRVTTGYLVVGVDFRPLPVGSSLDTENGVFYWMPGPGFVGEYNLVFVGTDEFGMQRKIQVTVNIKPKFGVSPTEFFQKIRGRIK